MTTEHERWEVAQCDGDVLQAHLNEGWEPYGALWVRKDKFTDRVRHFLKRRTASTS